MPKLIKDNAVINDDWQLISDKDASVEDLPTGNLIVPLALWQQEKASLSAREQIGVWLDSDQAAEEIAEDLAQLAVVAINFPVFSDGRGYSYARNLRAHYNYQGELRAIGDVLQDQLFYMKKVGFNSFALRDENRCEQALAKLKDFRYSYQATVEQEAPLFLSR